jgi:Zn-dependent protease with chaperone function
MDFFQAQAQAHKRTRRLVVLFVAAVVATVATTYLAVAFVLQQIDGRSGRQRDRDSYYYETSPRRPLWDPILFAGVASGTLLVIGGAALFKTFELRSGGPAVAEMVGGRRVDSQTTDLKERQLLNIVEEMSIASSVPVPAVYVLDDEAGLNAFAAGLTTSDAVVAVTRGSLERFNRDELQGVIAHEFSHILNGDMRLNIRLVSVLFGILFLSIIGTGILRSLRFTGGSRNKRDGRLVLVLISIAIILIVVGYIGHFFGRLIQAAVSRQREFLADASSVQFTRNPGGITGALKKIGGYSFGSRVINAHASAISHFFFAEGRLSNFLGLLATHPPLEARIKAIDPQFDGKFIEPAETIDITKESFVSAGLTTPAAKAPAPSRSIRLKRDVEPAAALATIGTLTPEQVENAQQLIDEIPIRLRQAARTSSEAPTLIFALLLDEAPEIRTRQIGLLPAHAAAPAEMFAEQIKLLTSAHKLPLCQLAQPALRGLSDTDLTDFFATIKALIGADGRVTIFEFALEKLLYRQLLLSRMPKLSLGAQVYSFQAMREPIIAVLSAMAHAASENAAEAEKAFAAGVAHLKSLEGQPTLQPLETCGPEQLDPAFDRLAVAAGPIKQRLLLACAQVAGADGQLRISEVELLRAIAACLDCPMPPLN